MIAIGLALVALCSAKCTHETTRNLEVVYMYDGYDPDHKDGFQDISYWVEHISGETYGAELKFTAVMSGGMNSNKCFEHVTGPTDDISQAVDDMNTTPWLGDDGESDYDSRNVLNTLIYATSLFDQENVWPEWDRILVYVSGNYVPDWGATVTQPSLAEGQIKCSGALEPPTRDQLVDALEAKRIKMVLSMYGTEEAKQVRYWFKSELFAHLKDPSMYAFHQPQAMAEEVVAKTRALVYQLYCVKNLQLTGYVDTDDEATRAATAYSGAISSRLDCLRNAAIKTVALSYTRKECVINRVRPREDNVRAHDVGIREAVLNYKPGPAVDEDHNSVTAIPYMLNNHLCIGDEGTLCVLTFIAEQPPDFASDTVDHDYLNFQCGQPTGSQDQMLGRLLEYMQELVVIVPPDLPNADEIYQQWKTAGEGIFTTRVFVIDPKVKIADETDRVAESLSNLLGWTLDDAQQAIPDPNADVEMQIILDNLSVGEVRHAAAYGRGLFGATGSFCAHWIHGHDLRGAMVEVGTDDGICATEGDSEFRPMDELGMWSKLRVYNHTEHDSTSCAVMREVLRRAELFTSLQEKAIRKVLVLITQIGPSFGTDFVDFNRPPDPTCDLTFECPNLEQLRAGLEMTGVSIHTLVRNKSDQDLWTKFWNEVGTEYHKEVSYTQYEIAYWDQLRQIESLEFSSPTFVCVQPPETPIRIFMIADSSHTQVTQDATSLAVMFAPYRLEKMLNSDIEITLYSSSLLNSPNCFEEIGPVTSGLNLDLIDSLPGVEDSESEDLSISAGALYITANVVNKRHFNLIVYATDKVYGSGSATSVPDPLTCPLEAPDDAVLKAAARKSRTDFIVGVDIVSTILDLEETWKKKTDKIVNIDSTHRSWAYNSMMAIAARICEGGHDLDETTSELPVKTTSELPPSTTSELPTSTTSEQDTSEPPAGIMDAMRNLAPLVAGVGAAVGIVMGGLAFWTTSHRSGGQELVADGERYE